MTFYWVLCPPIGVHYLVPSSNECDDVLWWSVEWHDVWCDVGDERWMWGVKGVGDEPEKGLRLTE